MHAPKAVKVGGCLMCQVQALHHVQVDTNQPDHAP